VRKREEELAYLRRREAHCRLMAEKAAEPWIRACHLNLADRFARRIEAFQKKSA
jgi:hypothetical protein